MLVNLLLIRIVVDVVVGLRLTLGPKCVDAGGQGFEDGNVVQEWSGRIEDDGAREPEGRVESNNVGHAIRSLCLWW